MNYSASDMEAFEYSALPARVVFGFGTLPRVVDEMAAMGRTRAFVLCDPHHVSAGAARLIEAVGTQGGHLSTDAVLHTPADVTQGVVAEPVARKSHCLISPPAGAASGPG